MVKILICEDEIDIREVLEMLIGVEFEAEFYHAVNGIEGIEHLNRGIQFDVIICDMNMPKSKGIDVYNYNKQKDNLPFILLSGDSDIDCLKIKGFQDCINSHSVNKPWEGEELLDKIRPILQAA
jgi:CheY-like chemotaxis protein